MYTDTEPMYGWESLPWFQLERQVFKLQKRIYQASARDDLKTVRRLQKLLIHNRAAKLLAVRRITQDNRGKNTPGIDGVCSLTPEERLELARNLKVGERADPVRRVYIPKHGTDELRPLGIPTMYDRALQTLVRLALEPRVNAYFYEQEWGMMAGAWLRS